jgi:hypothetical protein
MVNTFDLECTGKRSATVLWMSYHITEQSKATSRYHLPPHSISRILTRFDPEP